MLLQSAALVGQANAQCADPRGNSYWHAGCLRDASRQVYLHPHELL